MTEPSSIGPDPHRDELRIERLANFDSCNAEPSGADSFESEDRPAVALLRRAASENGLDLVPRWRAFLADEVRHAAPAHRSPPVVRAHNRWRNLAGWAAALSIGVVAGGAASPIVTQWSVRSAAPGSAHYTRIQRQLMFAMLDGPEQTSETLRAASIELVGCMTCHESALKDRLAKRMP